MKVLKFGGTSVGSVPSILSLKKIVEAEAERGPVVVVVSALDGITDKLIAMAHVAQQGSEEWRNDYEAIVYRHHQMIDAVITDETRRAAVLA